MARFERSRENKGKRDFKGNPPRRGPRESSEDRPRDRGSFEDRPRSRGSFEDRPRSRGSFEDRPRGRDSNNYSRDRREVNMTKVTCSSCGSECEIPFKPTSSKPVFCNDCFSKKDKFSPNNQSNKEFDKINEKLDKIMKTLNIE